MSELKPGRELDALIAEKVMGYRRKTKTYGEGEFYRAGVVHEQWYEPDDDFIACKRDLTDGKIGEIVAVHRGFPAYSASIGAAWLVVQKLRLCVVPWGETQWTAVRQQRWIMDAERFASDTAAEAVCRCALDAVEVTT